MGNLLILVDEFGAKKKLFVEFIAKKLSSRSEVAIASFSDMVYEVSGTDIDIQIDGIDRNIKDFDLVYFRRAGRRYAIPAGNLALCLKHLGIKFFDTTFEDVGPLGNKLTSYLKLSIAGVPTMPSFFCHPEKVSEYKNQIIENFGFTLVAKELSAQRGEGVFLV
jgi:glutathione synthase/RimK-type ligase-like ATP-grasp enzyme